MNKHTFLEFLEIEGAKDIFEHNWNSYELGPLKLEKLYNSLDGKALVSAFNWHHTSETWEYWLRLDKEYQEYLQRVGMEEYCLFDIAKAEEIFNKPYPRGEQTLEEVHMPFNETQVDRVSNLLKP